MKQTAKEFYDFYNTIPEEMWCTLTFKNEIGQCCAYGHVGCTLGRNTMESNNLAHILDYGVSYINDGFNPRYKQPTPKARILAALLDVMEGRFK